MASQNREQRRAERFGKHRSAEMDRWPDSAPNPALGAPDSVTPGDEATAGQPDQDQTHETGAGTGGATEHAGRVPRHSGTHATNSAKG